jgi:signal-induced proliferation-associated 1 like protein 1
VCHGRYFTYYFSIFSLHLGIQSGPCEEELIRLDEAYVQNKYKVGLLYCREGQQTEEEMYNNEEGGAAFNEFLDLVGQRVRLKGFQKYKAGLCNKSECFGICTWSHRELRLDMTNRLKLTG